MATTVLQSFVNFKSNLEISNRQVDLVSSRRTSVVNSLKANLSLHPTESLLIGSYDRQTMIKYLSEGDVDVLVILHYGNNKDWNSPEGTIKSLDKFKEILDASYPYTNKRRDRNCISMNFSEFSLDLVPAFLNNEGFYTIPDTIRKLWIKTNPLAFASSQTEINKKMAYSYIPLIKMVKAWNRNVGKPIRSFHLECIMHSQYSSYTQGYTYSSMLKVFFGNLIGYLQAPCFDPVTGDRVDTYLDNYATVTSRQNAINKAIRASELAIEACGWEDKFPNLAIDIWKQVLGEFFPNYG